MAIRIVRLLAVGAMVTLVAMAACAKRPVPATDPPPPRAPERQPRVDPSGDVRLLVSGGGVERLAIDDYVRGTVQAEAWVPATEARAVAVRVFELQAVIARTYLAANRGRHAAEGADVCDGTHCQVFRPRTRTRELVRELDDGVEQSAGRILLFDGRPALALFHASCGGATSSAESIWGGRARPYLQSVEDVVCLRAPQPWTLRVRRDDLTRALDADPRTRVDGRLDAIDVLARDRADRVALVGLVGARSPVVRGEELRTVLVRAFGARSIRSTRFTVRRDADSFVVEGTGFGHGAGLCQAGALARLRAGATVTEVISHYYPGVVVGAPGQISND